VEISVVFGDSQMALQHPFVLARKAWRSTGCRPPQGVRLCGRLLWTYGA
jgi:hypothetical protein